MCGRFAATLSPERFRQFYRYLEQPDFPPRFNIAPTQPVPVVVEDSGGRHFRLMRWGFVPEWVKDPAEFPLIINARKENVASKPSFKVAIRHRRCIFLADGFYEWQREGNAKKPYLFRLKSREPLPLAGLWETYASPDGGEIDTAAIVTTAANPFMAQIHTRMPVILDQEGIEKWLAVGRTTTREALALTKPCADDWLDMVTVSPRLNDARQDDAALQEEVPQEKTLSPLETGKRPGATRKSSPDQGSLF